MLANSSRISDRVRRVLRTPAENVRAALDRSVRDLGQQRDEMHKLRGESHVAIRYFENLLGTNTKVWDTVKDIDLEAPHSTIE